MMGGKSGSCMQNSKLFIALILCCCCWMQLFVQPSSASKQNIDQLDQDSALSQQQDNSLPVTQSSERVDKSARAAGDIYWPAELAKQQKQPPVGLEFYQTLDEYEQQLEQQQQQQAAENARQWQQLQQQQQQQATFGLEEKRRQANERSQFMHLQPASMFTGGFDFVAPVSSSALAAEPRNYRALVGDFKHWHLSNPSRQGRAFKPRIMSTARGFGKRSTQLQPHMAPDLAASYSAALFNDNQANPISSNCSCFQGQQAWQ